MASLSKKTKRIRKNKLVKSGKRRKRAIKKHGTTPPFPIHPDGGAAAPSKGKGRKAPSPAAKRTAPASRTEKKTSVARIPLKSVQTGSKTGTVVTETKSTAKPDPRSE